MSRGPGRPSKLTPEVRERLLQAFRLGATVKIAAGACGVHEASFYGWMAKGREAKSGEYRELFEHVTLARDTGDLELLALVRKHAKGDGRLALDLLSRRHPEAFARKDRTTVKHTGHDGGAIKVAGVVADLSAMSPEQLRAMLTEAPVEARDVIDDDPIPRALLTKQGDQ